MTTTEKLVHRHESSTIAASVMKHNTQVSNWGMGHDVLHRYSFVSLNNACVHWYMVILIITYIIVHFITIVTVYVQCPATQQTSAITRQWHAIHSNPSSAVVHHLRSWLCFVVPMESGPCQPFGHFLLLFQSFLQ